MTTTVLDLDGESFASAEYGVVVSNTSTDAEVMQALKALAQAGLQNDKLNFSDIMTIYMSESVSTVRRKIQEAEETRAQQAQQEAQMQQEQFAQELQQKTESEEAERRLKWDIAVLQSEGQQNEPSEVEGNDDLEYERLNLEREKHNDDVNLKRDALNETRRTNKVKEEQKNREITIKAKQPQTKAK